VSKFINVRDSVKFHYMMNRLALNTMMLHVSFVFESNRKLNYSWNLLLFYLFIMW
jgi:hypothetical protein